MNIFAQKLELGSIPQVAWLLTVSTVPMRKRRKMYKQTLGFSVENRSKQLFWNGVVIMAAHSPQKPVTLPPGDTNGSSVLSWLMNAEKQQRHRNDKGTCCQAQQSEFDPWNSHGSMVERPNACTLLSVLHTHALAHTCNKQTNKFSHIWGFQRQRD